MNETNAIIKLLKANDDGDSTGLHLMNKSKLTASAFESAAAELWNKGKVTGVRKNGCCRRGCGFMCVSYMKMEEVWRCAS